MLTPRTLLAALAILATLLTTGTVGAARGQAMAVGEAVLCANGMTVTVPVDADGQPTGVAHWCPDCVPALLAGLPAAPGMPAAPDSASAAPQACAIDLTTASRAMSLPPARGPPKSDLSRHS